MSRMSALIATAVLLLLAVVVVGPPLTQRRSSTPSGRADALNTLTVGTGSPNYLRLRGGATERGPSIAVDGQDVNVPLVLTPRGAAGVLIDQNSRVTPPRSPIAFGDIAGDYFVYGFLSTCCGSGLSMQTTDGVAYVQGQRIVSGGEPHRYPPNEDTYVDVDWLGNYTYASVPHGASPPPVHMSPQGIQSLRIQKVVTNSARITGVTDLRRLGLRLQNVDQVPFIFQTAADAKIGTVFYVDVANGPVDYVRVAPSVAADPATVQVGASGKDANINLQIDAVGKGAVVLNGHVGSIGTAPEASAGGSNGINAPKPTVSADATDTRGTIQFGSGASPSLGLQVVLRFARPYTRAPLVFLQPLNGATAALQLYTAATTTTASVYANVVPTASQHAGTYSVAFWIVQ